MNPQFPLNVSDRVINCTPDDAQRSITNSFYHFFRRHSSIRQHRSITSQGFVNERASIIGYAGPSAKLVGNSLCRFEDGMKIVIRKQRSRQKLGTSG